MKLVKQILHKFTGLHYPQEYLCLAKESLQQPLFVYLVDGKQVIRDITQSHLFTGYSPLIFALHSNAADKQKLTDVIHIIFSQRSHQPNEYLEKKDAIASLDLKMIRRQSAGDLEIVYYEGVHGAHRFISSFHQYMIGLDNRLTNKRTGNVFLHNDLYKQVQIAYSVPRVISLITVGGGKLFNLFPTDLHGPVSEDYYVSSLRHGGKACQQVETARGIVISELQCNSYKTVYSLGKNHMQDLKAREHFPFGDGSSRTLQLAVPHSARFYRELELLESFDHGIHRLLLYKILSQKLLSDQADTLAHIHNVYATWRHNKGLSGNYLLR